MSEKELWTVNKAVGIRPKIAWVPINNLKIDTAYQRAIDAPASERLIRQIACDWNWDLCSVLSVSHRGSDEFFVVDGQHRLEAARHRTDIENLPCIIVSCGNQEDEARMFVAINGQRRNPTPLDKFHAKVMIGDADAVAINDIVLGSGLSVGRSSAKINDSEICCVAVLSRMFRQYGGKILESALIDMAEAWPGEPMKCANEMLPGLCLLLHGAKEDFDPDLLIEVLANRKQQYWFSGGSYLNSDPENSWPDEVFRDYIMDEYQKEKTKRKAAIGAK